MLPNLEQVHEDLAVVFALGEEQEHRFMTLRFQFLLVQQILMHRRPLVQYLNLYDQLLDGLLRLWRHDASTIDVLVEPDELGHDSLPDLLQRLRKHLQELLENLYEVVLAQAAGDDGGDDCQDLAEGTEISLAVLESIMLEDFFEDMYDEVRLLERWLLLRPHFFPVVDIHLLSSEEQDLE